MSAFPRHGGGPGARLLGPLLVLLATVSLLGAMTGHAEPRDAARDEADGGKSERVELNSASVDQLCTLPGIGPKKAEAIIAFREKQPFTRVTQLLRVKGIGVRTLERLRPLIYVGPPARPASSPPVERPEDERSSPSATSPPKP